MRQKVLALCRTICSCGEADGELLENLCAAAEADVKNALRDGVGTADCPDIYACACAFLAAAAMETVCAGREELSSLHAGDVTAKTVSVKERKAHADALREQAWQMLKPYRRDESFSFCGVRV